VSLEYRSKNACQLEGSDHGGRDSAAELALAGTIDVQVTDGFCNRLTLVTAPSDAKNYTPAKEPVNGFLPDAFSHSDLTLFRAISILQRPLLATAR